MCPKVLSALVSRVSVFPGLVAKGSCGGEMGTQLCNADIRCLNFRNFEPNHGKSMDSENQNQGKDHTCMQRFAFGFETTNSEVVTVNLLACIPSQENISADYCMISLLEQ